MKKIITASLVLFIFCSLYIKIDGDNYITKNENTDSFVNIESLTPRRGEQNIISTPQIKIIYDGDTNFDYSLYLNYENITNKSTKTSDSISYKCDNKLKRGIQVVKLQMRLDKDNIKEIEWYFNVGTPFYNSYRGIFYNNTKDINLLSSYDDLNNFCKNSKKLDFVFITEKINTSSNKSDSTLNSKKYKKLIDSCDKFTNNHNFVSTPGFELSSKIKNKKQNTTLNIFGSNTDFKFKDNISLESLYKKLFYYEDNLICQFKKNSSLNSLDYFRYSPYGDDVISLIELNNNKSINLDTYKEALDNGWHVSPISCEYGDYSHNKQSNIFTTILCEDLSQSKLIDSLKNRSTYVSEDEDINIYYSLNKMPMGSIVKSPSYIRIILSAINNDEKDKIKNIQVFSNSNNIECDKNFNSNYSKIDITLPVPSKDTYYFCVITQDSNKKTITSPIWVEP